MEKPMKSKNGMKLFHSIYKIYTFCHNSNGLIKFFAIEK